MATPPPPTKADLHRHFFASYNSLRIGNAFIAFVFPLVLLIVGAMYGVKNPGSMSAYYWASPPAQGATQDKASYKKKECDTPRDGKDTLEGKAATGPAAASAPEACPAPTATQEHLNGRLDWIPVHAPPGRMWFVVGMFCIATFLYLYKGFSKGENYALNLAAVFSVLVACYPMDWNCNGDDACKFDRFSYCFRDINPHGLSAGAMFVCLAYVMFRRAMDTLPALGNPALERKFRLAYYFTGSTMILFPLIAGILHVLKNDYTEITFYLEAAGIWSFALYWVVKSFEMRYSQRA